MHDLNRTMGQTTLEAYEAERDGGFGEFQAEPQGVYEGEGDYEDEGDYEGAGDYECEGDYEDESAYEDEAEYPGEGEYHQGGDVLGEDELNELASGLLSVTSEQELDRFLGSIVRSFVRSPVARQLGGMLRNVAAQAVPLVTQALSGPLGALGGAGADHGVSAEEMFGVETEGQSNEDADFEVAKQFVRFAADAAHEAAQMPPEVSSSDAASHAITAAAQRHAPGLLMPAPCRRRRSGRWFRQGDLVIVQGI